MARILIVDDEAPVRMILGRVLKMGNHEAVLMDSVPDALKQLEVQQFDLAILDLKIGDGSGMEILRVLCDEYPDTPALMITGFATVSTAVEALKLGAFDYVTKPFKIDEFLCVVNHAVDYRTSVVGGGEGALQGTDAEDELGIIAASSAMISTCELVRHVAPTDAAILICGEKGTGKALLANILHKNSRRCDAAFMTFECMIEDPKTLELEMEKLIGDQNASGGTICFVEPQKAGPDVQAKLVDILDGELVAGGSFADLDMRIIATSSEDIRKAVLAGEFNPDLYAKLRSMDIMLKPLRERPEDILPLASKKIREKLGDDDKGCSIAPEAIHALKKYAWPDNIDELNKVIADALATARDGAISCGDLPDALAGARSDSAVNADVEFDRAANLKEYLKRSIGKPPSETQ